MADINVIDRAIEAQRGEIFVWMLARFPKGGRRITTWDAKQHEFIWFTAMNVNHHGTLTARRDLLDKLAAEGVIERKHIYPGPTRYRFSLEICTKIAEEAATQYETMGYSSTEIRCVMATTNHIKPNTQITL